MSVLKYSGRVVRKPGSDAASARRSARMRRHLRLRKKLSGTSERPRLVVTRSSRHIVAQIVDDTTGRVLASASSMDQSVRALAGDKTERARAVGKLVAERAAAQDITRVVFDRGGNQYHGRIAALADSAREGGLEL